MKQMTFYFPDDYTEEQLEWFRKGVQNKIDNIERQKYLKDVKVGKAVTQEKIDAIEAGITALKDANGIVEKRIEEKEREGIEK